MTPQIPPARVVALAEAGQTIGVIRPGRPHTHRFPSGGSIIGVPTSTALRGHTLDAVHITSLTDLLPCFLGSTPEIIW